MPERRPEVLHICKVYWPVTGGVQRVVQQIVSRLSKFNHCIVTTENVERDDLSVADDGKRVEVVRTKSRGQISSMPVAPGLIRQVFKAKRKANLLAVHYPFPLADLAILLMFKPPPIVVHWHSEIVAQKYLRWLVAPLTWLMLCRSKAVVVTSENMLAPSMFLRRFKHKAFFIPYGIERVDETENLINAENSTFVLIGRHVAYKGIDRAIAALKNTTAKLVIVGEGPLLDRHQKQAEVLGLSGRVEFVVGASDEQVVALLSQAIALVVPSVSSNEAFALVQLEAMRQGKPVINTQLASSVPWVARHQQEGLTVPAGDSAALAKAMQLLLDDKQLVRKLGEQAKSRFDTCFTASKFAQATEKLYSDIIAAKL